jgi:hypothetical protein
MSGYKLAVGFYINSAQSSAMTCNATGQPTTSAWDLTGCDMSDENKQKLV